MTPPMRKCNEDIPAKSTGAMVGVGGASIAAGAVGFGSIGYWYATDMGWTGYSGSTLVVARTPIAFGAAVAVACVLAGAALILLRHDVRVNSLGGVMLLLTVVALSIAVVVGVRAYPQVEQAELIAHGNPSWRVRLPITDVHGVRAATDRTITLEGVADRRGCDWKLRSVTIDLETGRLLEVTQLPTFIASGETPPPPDPIPLNFEVVPGATPFICRN